jgi:hypothetical protein
LPPHWLPIGPRPLCPSPLAGAEQANPHMQLAGNPASAIGPVLLQLVSRRRGSQRCFIWPWRPLDGGAGRTASSSAPDRPRVLHDGPNMSSNMSNPSLYVKMALTCRSPYLYPILLGRQAPFDGDVAGLGTSSVTWQSPGQWGSPVYRPPPS